MIHETTNILALSRIYGEFPAIFVTLMRDARWNEFLEAIWLMDIGQASKMVAEKPDVLHVRSGIGETPLHDLAVENHLDGVKWLYEKGSSINTKNEFGTPVIFEVALLGYKDLLLWLLDHDVDLQATDEDGNDLFSYLKEHEKSEILDFLQGHTRGLNSD